MRETFMPEGEVYIKGDIARAGGLIRHFGVARPHAHLGSGSFFVLTGVMEYRGGSTPPGYWVMEPAGAIHMATTFREETVYAAVPIGSGGGVIPLPEDGEIPEQLRFAGLEFYRDDFVIKSDTEAMSWVPSEIEGISLKPLRSLERTGGFAALVKVDAGTRLPQRKHLGYTSSYLISGVIEYRGGQVAQSRCWVYAPEGTVEDESLFPVETVCLVTAQAPIVDLRSDGSVRRVVDAEFVKAPDSKLAEVQSSLADS
jgi:hypothetical protein